jgi:phage terminase large subunit-like protein
MALNQPGSRGHVVGRTAADVRDVLVEGESGFLHALADEKRPRYEPSKRLLTWPNGSRATLFSADEAGALRGPQCHWALADEVAAWKGANKERVPEAWSNLLMGLRLGQAPRLAVATTPKPVPIIRDLVSDATCHVTRGSTYDNRANLAPTFFQSIITRYEGTRLGRQELNAELLEDVEGALWSLGMIDRWRVLEAPPLVRVAVGVDPKASVEADSETGIVAAGLGADGHFYILEDASLNSSPEQWGRAVVNAYTCHKADRIVPEVNQGGDMVVSVLRAVNANASIRPVHASRGKLTRAEPVAALYEQGKVHHVGAFAKLEDQMTTWVPGMPSPDRMDALVWALTDLMGGGLVGTLANPFYD